MFLTDDERAALAGSGDPFRIHPIIEAILAEIEAAGGPSRDLILGDSRQRHIVAARHIVMRAARRAGLSLPVIGGSMRRHHTTVINAIK